MGLGERFQIQTVAHGFFLPAFIFPLVLFSVLDLNLESLHQTFFVMDFFEIGSGELFTQAGFDPQSS
jgi:hypothetical protein